MTDVGKQHELAQRDAQAYFNSRGIEFDRTDIIRLTMLLMKYRAWGVNDAFSYIDEIPEELQDLAQTYRKLSVSP